ncbi:hypothetical protein AB1286_29165 [Trinickia sp. NRRL B-1857]|uniref:hypothetical protein n=1 Tax=Trinickia sp. NRRL B-1857 TaxID=3162879 RepID=UPI003D2C338A
MTQTSMSHQAATKGQVHEALAATDWRLYDGQLVMRSNGGAGGIFLIMNGLLRLVPDPATFANLFNSPTVQQNDYLVDNCPPGPAISSGAVIAQGAGPAQYLITNDVKMWIPSPAVVAQFSFNSPVVVPNILLEFISTGPNVG